MRTRAHLDLRRLHRRRRDLLGMPGLVLQHRDGQAMVAPQGQLTGTRAKEANGW